MFTPPPSPMPLPSTDIPSPPPLSLSPPKLSRYPSPQIPPSSLNSQPAPTQLVLKRRAGKRILLFVTLVPALLILFASLRYFIRLPDLNHNPSMSFTKRDSSTFVLSTAASTQSSSVSIAQSGTMQPSPTVSVPAIPTNPVLPTPLPQPYDTLSANFSTQGCEAFFINFTQSEDFRQCRAFSFLLNSSAAFLDAQRNLTLLNSILWATCNTPRTPVDCANIMVGYLSGLNTACHQDMVEGTQAVLEAQISFQSYAAMRSAACLADPSTNAYCYEEAIAAPQPDDVYFYALPLGSPLPSNTKPSCSPCVKSVLAVYAQYVDLPSGSGAVTASSGAGNSTSGVKPTPLSVLSKTYPGAARVAVNQCGGTYASLGVAQSGAVRTRAVPWIVLLLLGLAACIAL